ncbi:MAG: hypothetical protein ACREOU_12325 [Candidatus Eiseniibacteriota bacterium]
MRPTLVFSSILASLALWSPANGLPSDFERVPALNARVAPASSPGGPSISLSSQMPLDPNQLSLTLTNFASFAFDVQNGSAGLEYPTCSGRYVVFAAGLWVVANVGDDVHAAMTAYSTEFVPGPMAGGTYQPDNPSFRVYRVTSSDTTGYADWMANAVPQGAPTSAGGTEPLVRGDQTAWTVFNDADPTAHTNNLGHTPPLGLEVQLLASGTAGNGPFGYGLYLDNRLINKGVNTLDSAYVALWVDPDLGQFTDDLVGCDPALDLGYCYNSTNNDGIYGANPPAVGLALLEGPRPVGGGPPLGMTAFRMYVNGEDPQNLTEARNLMLGRAVDGSLIIDPTTTFPTRLQYAGDPVLGTGWLDSAPSDRRFAVSSGPFRMVPGDTETVRVAVLVGQGEDRLASVTALKALIEPFVLPVDPLPPGFDPSGIAFAVHPNPARGRARLDFRLESGSPYRIALFDAAGRRQRVIADGVATGTFQSETWDTGASTNAGALAPGIYWAVLSSGARQVVRRVVVLDR